MTTEPTQTTIGGEEIPVVSPTAPQLQQPRPFGPPKNSALVAAGWLCRNPWWDGVKIKTTVEGTLGWYILQGGYEVIANWRPSVLLTLIDEAGESWKVIIDQQELINAENYVERTQ